jgi:hypothetical protein
MDEGERFRAQHLLCAVYVESLRGDTDEITAARGVAVVVSYPLVYLQYADDGNAGSTKGGRLGEWKQERVLDFGHTVS